MPRRQRFKPSRKPKPAIEPSEQEVIGHAKPSIDQDTQEMNVGQRESERQQMHPDDVEDRVPR